jgi:hypothetical protein
MSIPVANFHPASILRIEGDPTSWGLKTVGPEDPGWGDDPVAIAIGAPVDGTLILSPARVSSFALTAAAAHNGWMPASLPSGSLFLYVPTTTGITTGSVVGSGYVLAPQHDNLHALQRSIMTAMSGAGSTLALKVDVIGGGVVILNGAQLPFAVVAQGA